MESVLAVVFIALFGGFLFIKNKDRREGIKAFFTKKQLPKMPTDTYRPKPLNVKPIKEK